MTAFLLRRCGATIVTLGIASLVVFGALQLLGGDPASGLLDMSTNPSAAAALRHSMGLDVPIWTQYGHWIGGVLQGDLGKSVVSDRAIGPQIVQGAEVTVPLAVLGMCLAAAIAIPTGLVGAAWPRRPSGVVVSTAAQIGLAVPAFWLGLLMSSFFAVRMHWLPSGGFTPWSRSVGGAFRSLVLPVLSVGLVQGASLQRYVQAAVSEVLHEDYLRTAQSKGLTRFGALVHHGLRNAALPVVTVAGVQFGILLGGVVIIENVYFLPGMGSLVVNAVNQRDVLLVRSTVMVLIALVIVVNLATDLMYGVLDPRTRSRG